MLLIALACLIPSTSALQSTQVDVPELTASNFDSIVEHVVPDDDELKWRSIPWRPTLWDGLKDGAEQRKPVLLWAMNGHPLGTT